MKNIKLAVCVILPAIWKTPEAFVGEFVANLFKVCTSISHVEKTFVFLAVETKGRENWSVFNSLSQKYPDFVPLYGVTGADLYLVPFSKALDFGADMILELDCSNAHDVEDISSFLQDTLDKLSLDKNQMIAVLSTRFALGGYDYFPNDRVMLSKFGTLFARSLLMLSKSGKNLSDLTSGFEAFSATLLRRMFDLQAPDKWVSSWWGPLHLFQTEARALVCWIAQKEVVTVYQEPITFGKNFNRKLAPLTIGYLTRAFIGGLLLILEGISIKGKLKRQK